MQDEAGGIAQALGLAKHFIGNSLMTVLLGDNIFQDSIVPHVHHFSEQRVGARIFLKEVPHPSRFGVPVFKNNRIVAIEEKPKEPQSSYAVTGVYMYDPQVFDIIANLKPSHRKELEISDVNNAYITQGILEHDVLQGGWTDAGTFESLYQANTLMHS